MGAGLAAAAMGLVDRWVTPVSLVGYLAAALLVVGIALVAATWLGRARGLLPVGLLLLVALVAISVTAPLQPLNPWRPERVDISSVAELPQAPVTRQLGQLHLNLAGLALTDDAELTAHVDLGTLVVTVPEGVNVVVNYDVEVGMVSAYGADVVGGPDLANRIRPATMIAGAPTLTLNLSVDSGEVRVER
jgi:hypothetical protein